MSLLLRKFNSIMAVVWLAAAIAGFSLALYFFQFHGKISSSSSEWANFGSYLGGVLSPIFAFMAFALSLHTLNQASQQSRRDELLKCIQSYERDFELSISKPVSCETPWIWGNDFNATQAVQEVSLRTLLQSDGIDWETHLAQVSNSLKFRVLADGELVQDRDLWLSAHQAVEGIFHFIDLYRQAGGNSSLANYLMQKYEIPRNRLAIAGAASSGVALADI